MSDYVFCDWLDCTYSAEDSPIILVRSLFNSLGMSCVFSDFTEKREDETWKSSTGGIGALSINHTGRYPFARVSLSGGVMAHIRNACAYGDLFMALSSNPYRITRLDIALDQVLDPVKVLRRLMSKYPETCRLGRKAVRTKTIMAAGVDGRQTGTFYIGDRRSGGTTARVYDKSQEMIDRKGVVIPPTARFEVTAKKGSYATLRDVSEPAPLFYHIASPSLLPRPSGVADWVRGDPDDTGWCPVPVMTKTEYEVLEMRVSTSPELSALVEYSDKLGPYGRSQLLKLLEKRVSVDSKNTGGLSLSSKDIVAA